MKTIAIIDDDVCIGDLLEELLHREGYSTLRAYSGTEARYLLADRRPDLVLLDRMLPGLAGDELLPMLQGLPVVVLSARADPGEKADLLLAGAADYITKPFDSKELLARIAVQLRTVAPVGDRLIWDDLDMNTAAHTLHLAKTAIKLTPTEYALLKLLMENAPRVMTKSLLLDRLSAETPDCTESSLKIHISNLRKKLRAVSGRDYIEAVWGIGFKLAEKS